MTRPLFVEMQDSSGVFLVVGWVSLKFRGGLADFRRLISFERFSMNFDGSSSGEARMLWR